MPYEIKEEPGGLYVKYSGFVSPTDVFEMATDIAGHPNKHAHRYHIFDFLEMSQESIFAWTPQIAAGIGTRNRPKYEDMVQPMRVAAVGEGTKFRELISAFLTNNPRPPSHEIAVFSTLAAARAWAARGA